MSRLPYRTTVYDPDTKPYEAFKKWVESFQLSAADDLAEDPSTLAGYVFHRRGEDDYVISDYDDSEYRELSDIPDAARVTIPLVVDVASHPRADVSTLARIAHCPNPLARWLVADNPSTPDWLLVELARDADAYVRARVAESGRTPPNVLLALLLDDDDPLVSLLAEGNANIPRDAEGDVLGRKGSSITDYRQCTAQQRREEQKEKDRRERKEKERPELSSAERERFVEMKKAVVEAATKLTVPPVVEILKSVAGVQKAGQVPADKFDAVIAAISAKVVETEAASFV